MTVCLSTNGPAVFRLAEAPNRLLVATLDGIDILKRGRPGAAWELTGHALKDKHPSALMVEPKNGGVFAGIHNGGLYFSADEGVTWERRTSGLTIEHVFSLAYVEDKNGTAIYAGTEPASLFRSRDNGISWEELPAISKVPGAEKWSFPPPPHIAHTKSMAFDPRDPAIFYASIEQGALLKTEDAGRSWREIESFIQPDDDLYKDIHRVVLLPSNPDRLYMLTGIGLYLSPDAGKTWKRITGPDFRIGYPDQLILSPSDERVMLMSGARKNPFAWAVSHKAEGTVLRTRDGGQSWEEANRGMSRTGRANVEAMAAAYYPSGYTVFSGTTDGEVYASENGGDDWSLIVSGLKPISKGAHFRHLRAAAE
jgi:photosystem II stability/assembly factor-like uncharacterized protein